VDWVHGAWKGAMAGLVLGFLLPLVLTQVFAMLALGTMESGSLRKANDAFVWLAEGCGRVLDAPLGVLRLVSPQYEPTSAAAEILLSVIGWAVFGSAAGGAVALVGAVMRRSDP
jgi:hypothetical protein